MTAHWGIEDPAAFEGSEDEKRRHFYRTFGYLRNRVMIFTCLPFDKLDKLSLQKRLDEVGLVRSGDGHGLGSDEAILTFLLDRHRVMSLPSDPHIKFFEGWLRLFLGMVQIIFATAAFTLLLTVGLGPITWVFVVGANTATIISRLLYKWRGVGR